MTRAGLSANTSSVEIKREIVKIEFLNFLNKRLQQVPVICSSMAICDYLLLGKQSEMSEFL